MVSLILIALALAGCEPLSEGRDMMVPDLIPPMLLAVRTLSRSAIEISFDEPVRLRAEELSLDPMLAVTSIQCEGSTAVIEAEGQIPGTEYILALTAEDTNRNSIQAIARFYGFNPRVPELKINEFTTRGSSSHPDMVELRVNGDGNMGGVALYQGTPGNFEDRLVFPAFTVREGEFIVVHFKPEGLPEEIDETGAKDQSGGLDASDTAFDFWVRDGSGISGNNGVISLYDRPGGRILDGVLYSNRTSWSDDSYLGFGTRDSMERALELAAEQAWLTELPQVRPEDGINPDGSTSTRSLCRVKGQDTDSRHDWYIVPTRKASFGEENCDDIYVP